MDWWASFLITKSTTFYLNCSQLFCTELQSGNYRLCKKLVPTVSYQIKHNSLASLQNPMHLITDYIIIVDDRGGSHIGFNPHSGPSHPNPNHFEFDAIAKMFIVIS